MRKILCISHGLLAQGMFDTANMIVGDYGNLEYYSAYVNGDEDVGEKIEEMIQENKNNELFVVTDIFGGSINNEWMKKIKNRNNIHLIAGMNLAFLIELIVSVANEEIDAEELVRKAMQSATDSFIYCNQLTMNISTDEF